MDGTILPNEKIQALRELNVLTENEVAYSQGDLLVAVNVVTQERRVLNSNILNEDKNSKRLLKG